MKYIYVRFNYDSFQEEHAESLSALPGVIQSRAHYPDDPALFNLWLLVVEDDDADRILEIVRGYELVDFVEFIEKPQPR